MQAEVAAAQEAKARAEADAARAQADAQRQAAMLQEQQARDAAAQAAQQAAQSAQQAQDAQAQAQQAQQLAEQSERDKQELRAKLLQQFNRILETRDTVRGLVVNIGDVLFDTGRYTLRVPAREALAKLSGIVLASILDCVCRSKAIPTPPAPLPSIKSSRNSVPLPCAIIWFNRDWI